MHGYLKICLDLFNLERHTVSALALSRICFVGAYSDSIQRAVISIRSDVSALYHGAVDFLVTVVVHSFYLLMLAMVYNKYFARLS